MREDARSCYFVPELSNFLPRAISSSNLARIGTTVFSISYADSG